MRGSNQSFVWQHVSKARETIKEDNQLAEYVAWLGISECAEILAESPEGLPFLAARRDECRVGLKRRAASRR